MGTSNLMLPWKEEMVVMGSGLGMYGNSASVGVGQTSGESTEWSSESSLTCKTPAGVFRTLRVTMTLGSQVMSMSRAVSYESAVVRGAARGGDGESAAGPTAPTRRARLREEGGEAPEEEVHTGGGVNVQGASGTLMSIIGDSFWTGGASPMGRVGSTGCELSAWMSETAMRCKAAVGRGTSGGLTVTLGSVTGSGSDVVSYDGTEVSGASARNGMSTQSRVVTIAGRGLGIMSPSGAISVRHGWTGSAMSSWLSDTSLRSLSPLHLAGQTMRVVVTAGLQDGSHSEVFTVDTGTLSSIRGANGGWGGDMQMIMAGRGFRRNSLSETVRVGQTTCERSEWMSATAMLCLPSQSVSRTRTVGVTSGVQVGSMGGSVSVDSGAVSMLRTSNLMVPGREEMVVMGSGLGM